MIPKSLFSVNEETVYNVAVVVVVVHVKVSIRKAEGEPLVRMYLALYRRRY